MKAFLTLFLIAAVAPAFALRSAEQVADQKQGNALFNFNRRVKKTNSFAEAKTVIGTELKQAGRKHSRKEVDPSQIRAFGKSGKVTPKDAAQSLFRKVQERAALRTRDSRVVSVEATTGDIKSHFRNAILMKLNGSLRGATECNLCVQFMDQFLNELLQIVLNGGVIGGCSGLCGLINGSSVESTVCSLLCDAVGIDAFINLIEDADLDPVWMCEEVDFCDKTTCTSDCAVIRTVDAGGTSFPAGATLNYTVIFGVLSAGVGVSTVQVALQSTQKVDGDYVVGIGSIFIPQATQGFFQAIIPVVTSTDDGNGGTDPFPTGTYNATVTFCEGSCGSDHNGSGEILASKDAGQITLH